MGDDRFSYLNISYLHSSRLLDEEDEQLGWDLPDDDIHVPSHLLPPYQDEDDDSILPSQAHPSYPYGNPYKPNLLASSSSSRRLPPSSSLTSSSQNYTTSHPSSLSTTLPSLELSSLFARTTFGDPASRAWGELNLPGLFGRKTQREREEERDERGDGMGGGAGGGHQYGDAGPPAGQNAGDAPMEEEDEDEEDGAPQNPAP